MSECSDITKAIQELSTKIDQYQKEVKNKISPVEDKLGNLTRKVDGLDQDIKNIISRVNNHEGRISKIEKDILSIYGGNNSRNNDNFTKQQLQQLKQQISAIEKYINALDAAGKKINDVLKGFLKIFSVFK